MPLNNDLLLTIAELRECVREVEAVQAKLHVVIRQKPDRWRHEVVQLRRGLSNGMGRIRSILSRQVGQNTPAFVAVRSAYSRWCSLVAELQASWPAVSLDTGSEDYHRSIGEARASFQHLLSLLDELERVASTSRAA